VPRIAPALLGLTLLSVAATPLLAPAPPALAEARHGCPKAESLVPHTKFRHHTLAPGISLTEGNAHDGRGTVDIRVLRVRLTHQHVAVRPLRHSLTERLRLSTLAAHHKHLVAATNTGYFDFYTGDPNGPLVTSRKPVIASTTHQRVVGIATNGRAEGGELWLDMQAVADRIVETVNGINELNPPTGVSVYTPTWGRRSIQTDGALTRKVARSHRLGAVGKSRRAPSSGFLLVARGTAAQLWLRALPTGTRLTLRGGVRTDAAKPFRQAYGTGAQIVTAPGRVTTGFSCDSANTRTPARTAIGYADGGKKLIVAIVADHPGTTTHGLDLDQMSKLMVQLGAGRAWVFDGSGSSELLAKLPHSKRLTLRNYPADGEERPMPLGLGIFD
jgi:hypothetical protein